MERSPDSRTVVIVVGLTLLGFACLVATTEVYEYGMPMTPEYARLWTFSRIPSMAVWLTLVLAVFMTRPFLKPASFVRASFVTIVALGVVFALPGAQDVKFVPMVQTVTYYAIGSWLLAMAFRTPSTALAM
ncbi:MAG: hypothetical protein ACC655_10780, partial [Rhodothermia bacterium]